MQATEDTAGLVWREMVDTDRMCRYHGYLALRPDRLGDLLQLGSVAGALAALASILSRAPRANCRFRASSLAGASAKLTSTGGQSVPGTGKEASPPRAAE